MKGFFSYFIKSYRVTFLIILGLAIFGLTAVFTLPREANPEVKIPIAVVVTGYPGASARDVEELVTNPIEDGLTNVGGVKKITSSSQLGISTVTVEFLADEDQTEAVRRLREAVDGITDLPDDGNDPRVIEISFDDAPIISIGLSGIDDSRLLSLYADELADELKKIKGVSDVNVIGKRNEEISVIIDPKTLADNGLSLGQVLQTIKANNINAPFGQLETKGFKYDLRLLGKFNNISDVADTPITLANGSVVPLSSIGKVELKVSDSASESHISVNGNPSTTAVTLEVRKKTGGNIVDIVDAIKEKVDEFKKTSFPPELQVTSFSDNADEIRTSLHNVTTSGLQTVVIVFAVLWLFLGWREAIIASLAVPFTFFISFIVFQVTDITLNGISLFSLILALGLLVDNAIVIVEGVYQKKDGVSYEEHASAIVRSFQKPLASGTLTTVAAFVPMLLVSGIIGQFLRTIPIVVSATLLSSLVVALAFLPAVAVRVLRRMKHAQTERGFDRYFNAFRDKYVAFMDYALSNRRFQNLFITTLVILMVIGLSLPFTGLLRTGLFPNVDIDFIIGNVELSPGAKKEATAEVMKDVETVLQQVPEISSFVLNTGSSTSFDFSGGGSSAESLGSFYINLNKERERTSIEITDELRESLKKIHGAKVTISDVSAGPPTAAPVELRVIGQDLSELDALSSKIMAELSGIPGAIEVDRDLRNSAGEFNFTFNREAMARYGLTNSDIAQALRTSIFGVEATNFLDTHGDEIRVQLKAPESTVSGIDSILAMPIQTRTGETIHLSQVATANLGTSINTIRHQDEKRTVTVTAKAASGFNPNAITIELKKKTDAMQLPAGYSVEYGGEQQETIDTFTDLYKSMVIAIVAILMILVIEFNSYRQPFIIFISIPLALIGVLFGLLITRGQLNFSAFIGLVSLTGIVVNNAILLVDRMNAFRKEGHTIMEAVKEATFSRLRPIILTTFTTAVGVLPLAWVDAFFRDLALTIVTGLLFSTILTLVLIPILYMRQINKMEAKGKFLE